MPLTAAGQPEPTAEARRAVAARAAAGAAVRHRHPQEPGPTDVDGGRGVAGLDLVGQRQGGADRDGVGLGGGGLLVVGPVDAAVSMPMTWPEVSTSEPPESPGWMSALVSMRPVRFSALPPLSSLAVMDWLGRSPSPRPCWGSRRRRRRCPMPTTASPTAAAPVLVETVWRPLALVSLIDGHVTGAVVADHGGRVGLAVADVGHADAGGAVDHVVVGEDLAVGGEHHAGAGRLLALVAEVGVDVDQARVDLGGDGGDVRRGTGTPLDELPTRSPPTSPIRTGRTTIRRRTASRCRPSCRSCHRRAPRRWSTCPTSRARARARHRPAAPRRRRRRPGRPAARRWSAWPPGPAGVPGSRTRRSASPAGAGAGCRRPRRGRCPGRAHRGRGWPGRGWRGRPVPSRGSAASAASTRRRAGWGRRRRGDGPGWCPGCRWAAAAPRRRGRAGWPARRRSRRRGWWGCRRGRWSPPPVPWVPRACSTGSSARSCPSAFPSPPIRRGSALLDDHSNSSG